jgi:serine/threonine-protein phosphatase 2A regulatory subunit B
MAAAPATGTEWQFAQVFGDKGLGEEPTEADVISAVEFDDTGDNLAIGDRGGRIVILRRANAGAPSSPMGSSPSGTLRQRSASMSRKPGPSPVVEYKLYTEFQSHQPEFDYLKSVEIEEKINQIKWLKGSPNGMFMLTTNDKTIKLWKVFERAVQNVSSFNVEGTAGAVPSRPGLASPLPGQRLRSLRLPKVSYGETVVTAQQKRVFGNGHTYHINSISQNSDGETFLSADDLRINLWHLQVPNESFNIVDIKPSNMDDLNEVVTSASFHPHQCNTFMYSSSRGIIKLVDMRQNALCDRHSKGMFIHRHSSRGSLLLDRAHVSFAGWSIVL